MGKVDQFLSSIGFKPNIVSPLPKGASMADGAPAVNPTPTPYPGEDTWVLAQFNKRGGDARQLHTTYRKAVQDKGFTGNYFGQENKKQTPQPTQGMPINQAVLGDATVAPNVDEFLKTNVFPVTQKYGIPDAVAAGQFAGEGRMTGLGASRNNFFNIQAYDGKEGQMPYYADPQQGVDAYARTIAHDPRYKTAMKYKDNPQQMIKEIHKAGYASRPDYPDFVMQTPEFRKYVSSAGQ